MGLFERNLILMRVIVFFNAFSKLFAPVQTIFFLQSGLNLTQVGILTAMVWGSNFLLQLPSGVLADLRGRKLSLVISNLCLLVACLIYLLVTGFEWFLLATLVYGGHKAFRSGADSS